LFIQARGVLKKELLQTLRSQRTIRRSKQHSMKHEGLGKICNAVSIRERPASVEDRAVPGHWEGDLIAGCNNSYIATLVERQTRYVMLVRVTSKDTETVIMEGDLGHRGRIRGTRSRDGRTQVERQPRRPRLRFEL